MELHSQELGVYGYLSIFAQHTQLNVRARPFVQPFRKLEVVSLSFKHFVIILRLRGSLGYRIRVG